MARYKNYIYMHIYLEQQLKKQLEKEAHEKGLSLNAYVRLILNNREQ